MLVTTDYVCDVARENIFPKSKEPDISKFERLVEEAGIRLDSNSLKDLALLIVEDVFMSRER